MNPSLKSEFSAKKTHWLSHWVGILVPYGLSVVAVAAAMGLRIVLTAMFGPGLPAYITFYPMVMAVALLSGFGPGLMAMAISVGIAMYYILPPTGQFAVASPIDRVGLVIYLGMGLFMSIVAEFYRRYRAKALVYDNEMKLRESQQALRDSEERNQLIVGHTRDYAIFMLDPQGRIATWNPGAERIKGYQAEEIIGQHFSCFYHKEAVASDWPAQELQIAEAEGRCEDVGWRIRKDGSRFWADVIITRLLDDAGHLKGFSKITRDLTQQKQAEELLNDSKRRIEGILESAMDAIISVYADQRIVLFNAAAEKMFRCAANEAIGTSVERFIPIRARSAHAAHIRRFAETGTTSRAMGQLGNIMGLRVDGSEFPIEASISQAEASGKKIFTVILRDITESKLVEETLHKAAAFNEAALRSLGEGLYTIDDKGLVTSMNPAAEELFGWSLAELRGKKMHDMTHHHYPDGRPFPACECAGFQVLTNGMPLKDHEDVFIRKDGTFFAVTYSIAPLRDASGQINGLVVVFQDITERKRAEKALRENREDFIRAQEVGQIGWWRMDTTKNVLTWSDESYCIFGVPKGTPLTYESFLNCVHPDDRDYVHTQWMEGLTGVPYDLEHRIVVGSAVKWVREKAYLEFGEDGMLLGGFGVTQDITERKQAEDALKVSERLQRFLALIGELAVRSMMDTELLEGICAAVAGELSVSRCGFARVDLAAGQITVVHDYHSQLPSLAGRYPMVGYADYLEDGQVGCTVLFADLATDPRTAAFYEEGFAPIHVRAHLTVPLLRNGQWVANFWVSHHEPRLWTVAESELMRVIADRVWSFVENKRVEEKLRESELLLRTATDNAAVGLVMLDRNRHYVFANPAYCDILGLELNADELIGMSPAEVLAPVYTTQVSSRLDRAFRGECVSYELMRPGPDNGDSLYYVVVYDPKHDGADVVDGVIVTIFDITLRKQAENALRESQEDFVRAQEVGKLGWWRMDTVNNVLTFSGESYRIFGIPQGTPLTYESFLATLHPEDHDYVHTRWSAALKGELYDVEYRILADGVTKWVRAKSYLEFGKDGSLLGGFGIVQDITDRKQAEIALKQADRQKNEFLAMLGHELRNPLTPISNIAQTLGTMPLTGTAIAKAAEMLSRNVNHITHIVNDLLDVSRITRGLVAIDRQPIELSTLLKDTTESVQPFFNTKQQTLTLHMPPQPIYLDGDPIRLTQVFGNLLTNASKYTGEDGHIDLRVNLEGQSVVVRVQDNGIGIEPQLLPHIFGLFTQGERALGRSEGGLGLGLTLVKKLVEMHGGKVTADSQGTNQGSEFVVTLPTIVEGSVQAEPVYTLGLNKENGKSLRILMIDDNEDVLGSISLWLEMAGHQVETANNGTLGLSVALSFVPDIILLDIGLPDMDGYQVAKKLREQPCTQRVPIIAMSGYSQGKDSQGVDKAGFDHYLIKPPKLSELQNLLEGYQRTKLSDRYAQPPLDSSG